MRYAENNQLGMIANAHLATADRSNVGAFDQKCYRLAALHSDAVDFPKTGIPAVMPRDLRVQEFPDYMEKPDKPMYMSRHIIGKLYRAVKGAAVVVIGAPASLQRQAAGALGDGAAIDDASAAASRQQPPLLRRRPP